MRRYVLVVVCQCDGEEVVPCCDLVKKSRKCKRLKEAREFNKELSKEKMTHTQVFVCCRKRLTEQICARHLSQVASVKAKKTGTLLKGCPRESNDYSTKKS